MSQCAVIVNISGQDVLAPSLADPCTTFVVLTPVEYAAIQASPFNLSAEDGLTLSVAILGVWAVAYSFRAIGRALNTDGEPSS
jgi:hypothetical protein